MFSFVQVLYNLKYRELKPTLKNQVYKAEILEKENLENLNLENVYLGNVNQENPALGNLNLENSDLQNLNLDNVDLENFNLENPDLENPDLENLNPVEYLVLDGILPNQPDFKEDLKDLKISDFFNFNQMVSFYFFQVYE